jgi:hypothetical protein
MKLKPFITFLMFSVICAQFINSQPLSKERIKTREKVLLNTMYSFNFAEGNYIVDGEVTDRYENDLLKTIGYICISCGFPFNFYGNYYMNHTFNIYPPDPYNDFTTVTLGNMSEQISWDNNTDLLKTIRQFSCKYDDQQRLAAYSNSWGNRGKTLIRKTKKLAYDEKGNIVSVTATNDEGSGKYPNIKVKKTLNDYETTFKRYEKDGYKVLEVTQYSYFAKNNDVRQPGSTIFYKYKTDGDKFILIKESGSDNSKYLFKEAALISYVYESPGSHKKDSMIFEYGDKKYLVKRTIYAYKNGALEGSGITEYTYEMVKDNYKKDVEVQRDFSTNYDKDGNPVSQGKGGLFRKFENGSWGPWIQITY